MSTTTTATQQPSIFRLFYTFKRTQLLLESGWTNAQGVIVSGVKVKRIEKVSTTKPDGTFYNCVHVVYISASGKRCSQFISCRAYLQRATEKRKQEAENYKAYQNFSDATRWSVYPKGQPVQGQQQPRQQDDNTTTKVRTVITVPEGVFCDCEDWSNQADYLSQHPYLWNQVIKGFRICKHSLATLSHLGFGSLRDYMNAWKPEGRLSKLGAVMNRTTRSRTA